MAAKKNVNKFFNINTLHVRAACGESKKAGLLPNQKGGSAERRLFLFAIFAERFAFLVVRGILDSYVKK